MTLDDGGYTLIQLYVEIESEIFSCFSTILLVLYYNYFLVTLTNMYRWKSTLYGGKSGLRSGLICSKGG